MVARLFRLRVALLFSVFRAPAGVVARRMLFGLLASLGAVALAWVPSRLVGGPMERAAIDTVVAALVLAVALVVPFFANRRHLEPRQFGQFPSGPASVATALLVTTVVGWPVLWLLVWGAALVVLRPEWAASGWAVAAGIALAIVLAIVAARFTSALSKLAVPRQSAGALRAVGLLLLLAALPVAVFAVTQALRAPGGTVTADAAETLGWTPLGAPIAGIALAAAGDSSGALLRFGIALAAILVLTALWFPLVKFSLESIDRPVKATAARTGLGWFERVPSRPAWVIGARALSYWSRDPRYRVGLIAIPFAPIVMLVALWVAGLRHEAIALVPLPVIMLLFGWSLHNDIATDSTAIWMHVASGTRGRADRAGRLLPVMLFGLPLALIGSSVTVTIVGDWRVLPAVLGMNAAVLLVACGVSSVSSALMPYPTTRPGDSPFAQPAVSGSGAGLSQTLSMLGAGALSLPPVLIAAQSIADPTFGANLLALVFGLVYGLLMLVGGVLLGGRIFDRGGPELIAITQTFD